MNNDFMSINRQKAIQRYVSALDSGNLDDVLILLEEATKDPVLDQMIIEVNQAIEQEEGLTPFAKDANLVRDLAQTYFDHTEIPEDERHITIRDVAARMQADRRVPVSDQEIHKHLLKLSTPLPEILNFQAIRKLASKLGIDASEKFWRVFRDTAIMLGIGRGQARMAAARKQSKSSVNKNQEKNQHK
jgi:hypothetical protein